MALNLLTITIVENQTGKFVTLSFNYRNNNILFSKKFFIMIIFNQTLRIIVVLLLNYTVNHQIFQPIFEVKRFLQIAFSTKICE